MPAEKATALVLRVVDFSESSCIVTLFTREFGKIGALAKGGRRPKGPFEAALDLLATCRVVFLRKSSDALDLLTEAKLTRRFRPTGRDMSALYAGYYVAELVNELTDTYDAHPEVFDLCESALRRFSEGGPLQDALLRFELSLLRLLGHQPSLDSCVQCGQPIFSQQRTAFGLVDGGVLCLRCRPGKRNIVMISPQALAMLDDASKRSPHDDATEDADQPRGEVRAVMNKYLTHLVGRRLRMHSLITSIHS